MKTKYVDAHAHINEEIFDKDRDEIIRECEKKGILIIDCGGTKKSNRKSLNLAKKYSNIRSNIGICPTEVLELNDTEFFKELNFIEQNKNQIVGLGESGIDKYWFKKDEEVMKQYERFKEIIWLANKLKLPLNVHSRAAEAETIAILSKSAHVPVLLHSFDDVELAKVAVKECFYIGIAPIVVRSNKHKRLVETLPIDNILTETDSPYRGITQERNDPRNIPLVVEKIAEIKKMDIEETRKILLENAKKVFRLDHV